MKPIGGYFEWEFPPAKKFDLHENAVFLNSGRHALEYILQGLNVKSLWIPYFTCDAVLQPLQKLGISWKFYRINENLEIAEDIHIDENEVLLYTNYYGIKEEYCKQIAMAYGNKAIIDNAQALFSKSLAGGHQFYSPRKFMGMPDGGLAVTTLPDTSSKLSTDISFDRCKHLLKRMELPPSEGYSDFKEVSKKIAAAPLSKMSAISESILLSADLESIKQKRRENFEYLHKALASRNRLAIPPLDSFACPLVYPYWPSNNKSDSGNALKKKLIEHEIFVATYWPNVFEWTNKNDLEHMLANDVVCLPIDQRYSKEDMERMVKVIL